MDVTVSVFGRFHAFYLAHELYKRGHLKSLITSYPKFEVKKYGIPAEKTESLLSYELIDRAWNRWLPKSLKSSIDIGDWFDRTFGQTAARHIPENTDIYVGWSGKSKAGLERAKQLGALTILERGSSHPEFNRDILIEEYEKYGLKSKIEFQKRIYDRESLQEYELADFVSTPSEFVRQTYIDRGFAKEKLLKVTYGVDLQQFQQSPKTDDVFRVIFAGGMTLRKGVHYLLQAFAELKLPKAQLWLLGTKSTEIEPFFAKYEGTFHHFGHLPQSELHKYYSQCSVFVMPSIEEGLALVQPQAMACGLPLICTTNTGGEDLIRDGKEGFVIPIRNIELLKEKILWCYENQEHCRLMGQAAKKIVAQGFSWHDYGERIIAAYQKCLESK
jgi:glycosyltransferase involved in cell wall biosynthesis